MCLAPCIPPVVDGGLGQDQSKAKTCALSLCAHPLPPPPSPSLRPSSLLCLYHLRYEERLRAPPTDSDEETLSSKVQQQEAARIAADDTGGKGVNFLE